MLLGIAYHAALSLALGLPWLVLDREANRGFFLFQAAVHGFRMPLFFLVSGFFTTMLWRSKGLRALLNHRLRRVLLPFLLGLVTVLPVMNWAAGWAVRRGAAAAAPTPAPAKPVASAVPAADFWSAIRQGDAAAARAHPPAGAELNAPHPILGATPLMAAAAWDWREVVEQLLAAGAQVNARGKDGGTPLHTAAFFGRAGVAELLLAGGADVNATNGNKQTPLDLAGVDYAWVEGYVASAGLPLERKTVEAGRRQIIAQLQAKGARPAGLDWGGAMGWLLTAPLFSYLWFLWVLWWLVLGFALFAWRAQRRGGPPRVRTEMLAPTRLLWWLPPTILLQALMGSEFGPDTPMGVLPYPHVFAYYALFFAFGARYFDARDTTGRVGAGWRWTLPLALLVLLPLGLELNTGKFGWRDRLLPAGAQHLASVVFQALYAWLMTFGCMGAFRALLTRESRWWRYLSDASYWLYLTHLPLIVLAQAAVRDWPLPAGLKWMLVTAAPTGLLLLAYDRLVRYTCIGTLLNGKRTRPPATPQKTIA